MLDVFADQRNAVQDGGANDDGGAVLVVVEHRDLHALAQLALDGEAFRRLDVFQVDAAEGRLQRGDDVDQLVGVGFVDFNVEDVDAGELLEQYALAFHHRLGRQRADIAQAQHGGTVGDHRHQVAARGVLVSGGRIDDDLFTRRRHSRRVRQRQVALVGQLLGRRDADLARRRKLVILERCDAQLLTNLCFFLR